MEILSESNFSFEDKNKSKNPIIEKQILGDKKEFDKIKNLF